MVGGREAMVIIPRHPDFSRPCEGLTVDARTRGERSVSVQSVHHCCWVLRSAPAQHEITHLGDLGVGFLFENVARDSDAV